MNYYNEIDPFAAGWLRNLIAAGLIPQGDVDTRSIVDVQASDLQAYTQCHFFSGIGGWSRALDLAGWPSDKPVWTGSCPCQSFSAAGKGEGFSDPRHLWPVWYELIRQCKPSVVFGEQVEAAIKHGWLDLVQTDLEREGYAVGPVVLPAAGFGAPHIRSRLFYVAHANNAGLEGRGDMPQRTPEQPVRASCMDSSRLTDSDHQRCNRQHALLQQWRQEQESFEAARNSQVIHNNSTNGFWGNADWLLCTDGKLRPTEPGLFPLANGVPHRVGKLRGYGNAIVPQVAAEVINAYMEYSEGVTT